MIEKKGRIKNKIGMREAALFVKTASSFKSGIKIIRNGLEVNGKSILSMMEIFGTGKTNEIIIKAEGEDEKAAISTLSKLVKNGFKE